MKKIVGILAAAALAASVFAVDFTAGVQLKGELFSYKGADNSISAMKIWHENSKDDKPVAFSLSTDRAGATLKFFDGQLDVIDTSKVTATTTTDGAAYTTTVKAETKKADAMIPAAWNIWFKPFDQLQIDLGATSIGLNCETITYYQGAIFAGYHYGWGDGLGDFGYKATFTFDAFKFGAALLPGNNTSWLTKAQTGDPVIGETAFFAEYGADFGTIKFLFDAKDTFKNLKIGAGYNNKFGDISMFFDAGVQMKSNVTGLRADFDIAYAKDAISVQAWAGLFIGNFNSVDSSMTIPVKFKAAYALNGGSLYFKFFDDDLKANNFAATFDLGYAGNVGAMAYDIYGEIKLANNKVDFSIPVSFKASF